MIDSCENNTLSKCYKWNFTITLALVNVREFQEGQCRVYMLLMHICLSIPQRKEPIETK